MSSIVYFLAQISKICVRDASRKRDFTLDPSTVITTDVEKVLGDEGINCVVEVMGGTGLAKDVVLRSLASGKHVVTANKALIAEHMDEIQSAISSAPGSPLFAYEAAVCGGIPIINTLQTCYSGDNIHELMGICNGTTNFMLCKMEKGADYAEVLKEAQVSACRFVCFLFFALLLFFFCYWEGGGIVCARVSLSRYHWQMMNHAKGIGGFRRLLVVTP